MVRLQNNWRDERTYSGRLVIVDVTQINFSLHQIMLYTWQRLMHTEGAFVPEEKIVLIIHKRARNSE
jgi:hypothetical protein